MIKISLLLLVIIVSDVQGQDGYQIRLFLKSQCSGEVRNIKFYRFEAKGKRYESDTIGTCILPEKSIYKLSVLFEFGYEYPLTYLFDGQKADTLFTPRVQLLYDPTTRMKSAGYFDCSKTANGWEKDYFKKGLLRMEGCFRNGRLIGRIKKYDFDGNLVAY